MPRSHTLTVGRRGYFEVWDSDTGILLKRVFWREASHDNLLTRLTSSPDGKQVAVIREAGGDNYVYVNGGHYEIGLFDTRTWRRTYVFS